MNILFMIGNGFDLNIGLDTKYDDFMKYYTQTCEDDNEHIKKMKVDMNKWPERWSDFELKLGDYTRCRIVKQIGH